MNSWARGTVRWYWSAGTLFWQLSVDHNIDVQLVFPWAPKLARKCESRHWFSCGADGRSYGHVITKFSRMGRLPHFLTYGAPPTRAGGVLLWWFLKGMFINISSCKMPTRSFGGKELSPYSDFVTPVSCVPNAFKFSKTQNNWQLAYFGMQRSIDLKMFLKNAQIARIKIMYWKLPPNKRVIDKYFHTKKFSGTTFF